MNKKYVLNQLDNIKEVFTLHIFALRLYESNNEYIYSILKEYNPDFINENLSISFLDDETYDDRKFMCEEFLKEGLRNLIKESFEVVKTYFKNNKKIERFKERNNYDFFSLLRNSVSHDFRIDYNRFNKDKLPLNWKDKTLKENMDGKLVYSSFFSCNDGFLWIKELKEFVDI